MIEHWQRLADAIRDTRLALGWTQEELGRRIGVSRQTVQNLEDRGRMPSRMPPTVTGVEQAVGWPAGTGRRILAGGEVPAPTAVRTAEPGHTASDDSDEESDLLDELPLALRDALRGGQLIDGQVIKLTEDASMVVIVKRGSMATRNKDVVRRDLDAWRRAERALRGIPTDDDA